MNESTLPRHGPTASGELTRVVLRFAEAAGADPEQLVARLGLPLSDFDDPEARVTAGPFFALIQALAEHSGDEAFGLRVGEASTGRTLLPVMASSCDLGQAIDRFFRFHALLADFASPRMERAGDRVRLLLDGLHPDQAAERHYLEGVLANLVSSIRQVTTSSFKPLEVRFAHPEPASMEEANRVFAAPVLYGQTTNELVLSTRDLERTLFLAKPELVRSLEVFAVTRPIPRDARTYADRVAAAIRQRLLEGVVTDAEGVADHLGMDPRVLKLHLQREETAFGLVLDAVLADMARAGLADDTLSLVDLAFVLGFTQLRDFVRAFSRWEGVSPNAYRRRLRGHAGD